MFEIKKAILKLAKANPKFARALVVEIQQDQVRKAYWPEDRAYRPRGRRTQKPKYPGIFGPEANKAIAKGYLNLGLGDPKLANPRAASAVADWVGMQLLKNNKTYLLDPEGLFKKLFGNESQAAQMFKDGALRSPEEALPYAYESEDMEAVARLHKAIDELKKKRVQVKAVVGKLGPGYKITW